MFTIESAIIVPGCFLIILLMILSSADLYENTRIETRTVAVEALNRRDTNEIIKFLIPENNDITRKSVAINPIALINLIHLTNDSKNILFKELDLFKTLQGFFYDEK